MASGSASFQGFPFGSGHITHSNPSLVSFPFFVQSKVSNPFLGGQSSNSFQGWNPTFSGLGTGNQFMSSQQGNVPFSSIGNSQGFFPFANAWNPYQGFSSSFNTSFRWNIQCLW